MTSRRWSRLFATIAAVMFATATATLPLTWSVPSAQADVSPTPNIQAVTAPPSPSVGATNRAAANPPGSADGDRDDWTGMKWLPFLLLTPVIVAVGIYFAQKE